MLRKLTAGFLISVLLLTWFSWKLDCLRTPVVVCVSPMSGQLPDINGELQSYSCILPSEAVYHMGGYDAVYLVEETSSFFYPVIARQLPVTVQMQADGKTAVSGLSSYGVQIVLYSSRPLSAENVPVQVWEEASE